MKIRLVLALASISLNCSNYSKVSRTELDTCVGYKGVAGNRVAWAQRFTSGNYVGQCSSIIRVGGEYFRPASSECEKLFAELEAAYHGSK